MEVVVILNEKKKGAIAKQYGDIGHQQWERYQVMGLLQTWEASEQEWGGGGVESHCGHCRGKDLRQVRCPNPVL